MTEGDFGGGFVVRWCGGEETAVVRWWYDGGGAGRSETTSG